MMSKKIQGDQWVWVVVQNPGGNEEFLGQRDEERNVSFIPIWLEKEAAVQCMGFLAREKGLKYEAQAILYEELTPKAAEAGFKLFVLDASGKVLEQIAPSV